MKKVLQFLEKNVQWATLALGAAFLFYMIWSYVFVNPAARSMPGSTDIATPGTVDREIDDGPAATLDQKAHGSSPTFHIAPPANPAIDLNAPATQPAALALGAWDSWQLDVDKFISPVGNQQGAMLVQALPVLPAVQYLDQEPLRTVLGTPDAGASAADKHDQDAVTTFWAVPIQPLADAFQSAFGNRLPDAQQTVLFAHADLIRQKQLGDGSWGEEETVERIYNVPPPPPYPDPKDAGLFARQANDYKEWLQIPKAQLSIVSADFPSVAYPANPSLQWRPLDQWVVYRADQENLANNPAPSAAAPGTTPAPTTTPPPGNGPFENPAPAPAPPPYRANNNASGGFGGGFGGGGGEGGGGGGGGGRGQNGGGSGSEHHRNRGANGANGRNGGSPSEQNNALAQNQNQMPATPPQEAATPEPTPAAPPAAAPAAAPVVVVPPTLPKLQPVPDGAFSPGVAAANGDMEIYFHDLTVESGNTYRYKVRYGVFNPVFGNANEVDKQKPQLASAFTIDSPDSGWSDPVVVPARTRFWCSPKQPHGEQGSQGMVAFTIFSWHDGTWQHESANAVPGDEIGDGQFLTHWTLLDVKAPRLGSDKRLVLLVPDNGAAAEERGEQEDATSPDYLKFQHDYIDAPDATGANGNSAGPAAGPTQTAAPPPPPPPAPVVPTDQGSDQRAGDRR